MSKGSQIISVRIPDKLLVEIEKAVHSANQVNASEPYNVGSWIRKCVQEKLAHLKRSRRRTQMKIDRRKDIENIPLATADQRPQDVQE